MTRRSTWIAWIALLALGCPIGPFSGGRLGGVEEEAPAEWAFVNDVENCQLETNPEQPHSINCWCYGRGSRVYVPSSMILGPTVPTERQWVQNVQANPAVRLRVDDRVFALRAVRVPEGPEYQDALAALWRKYDEDPAERDPEREIWLYRLEPR